MTIKQFSTEFHLWPKIEIVAKDILTKKLASPLLEKIATIPVNRSRATYRLGIYISRAPNPICIRLQFAQEPENLRQTFLHEVAHACDHLSRKGWRKEYRQAHGESWKVWARALGVSTSTTGESEAVCQLHQQRLKLVGVCQKCGFEIHRVRRLNKKGAYIHSRCGGEIRQL